MDTWWILVAICVLLLFLVLTLIVLMVYSGIFQNVEVGAGKPPIGKVSIAYKFARGPYHEVGPLFTQLATIAPDNKVLGIYYDNPQKVKPHRLRHAVASILAEDEQEADKEMVKKFEAEGFKIMELPAVDNAVYSSFPHESDLSICIGQKKVFSKMFEFIQEHGLQGHPYLEIYVGSTIHFMAPLDRQQEFYVPESLQQFPGEEPYEPAYPDTSSPDSSESDTRPTQSDTDKPEEPSLLHPCQVVRATQPAPSDADKLEEPSLLHPSQIGQAGVTGTEVFKKTETIGAIEKDVETTTAEEDKSEKAEKIADKAESKEADAEEVKEGEGCDKESSSSFEQLDMEDEEMSAAESPSQSQ